MLPPVWAAVFLASCPAGWLQIGVTEEQMHGSQMYSATSNRCAHADVRQSTFGDITKDTICTAFNDDEYERHCCVQAVASGDNADIRGMPRCFSETDFGSGDAWNFLFGTTAGSTTTWAQADGSAKSLATACSRSDAATEGRVYPFGSLGPYNVKAINCNPASITTTTSTSTTTTTTQLTSRPTSSTSASGGNAPTSCAEVKSAGSSVDGNYTLLIGGQNVIVYCYMMGPNATGPMAYITLPQPMTATQVYDTTTYVDFVDSLVSNTFSYVTKTTNTSGNDAVAEPITMVTTTFEKLRIDETTTPIRVYTADYTFATTEQIDDGGESQPFCADDCDAISGMCTESKVAHVPFGFAGLCTVTDALPQASRFCSSETSDVNQRIGSFESLAGTGFQFTATQDHRMFKALGADQSGDILSRVEVLSPKVSTNIVRVYETSRICGGLLPFPGGSPFADTTEFDSEIKLAFAGGWTMCICVENSDACDDECALPDAYSNESGTVCSETNAGTVADGCEGPVENYYTEETARVCPSGTQKEFTPTTDRVCGTHRAQREAGLSAGAIAGVALGSVAFIAIAAAVVDAA